MLVAVQARAQATITNGTISLGVNALGALNRADGTPFYGGTGVRYNANGWDGTYAGCTCEGWGAGISGGTFNGQWGGQNTSSGGVTNLTPVSFTSTASTATSVVDISGALRVTQDYHPSKTANLYQVDVTLTNLTSDLLGSGAQGIRYRRTMDWDIPVPGDEVVSLTGWGATNLIGTSSNGFTNENVFANPGAICGAPQNSNFSNIGPCDHGANFDFAFNALGAGASKTFTIFYGAAANLADVKTALGAVGAEVASWGFCASGRTDPVNRGGTCTGADGVTFVFGFQGVGGTVIVPPTTTPEPSTYVLMASGLAGLGLIARRRRTR